MSIAGFLLILTAFGFIGILSARHARAGAADFLLAGARLFDRPADGPARARRLRRV